MVPETGDHVNGDQVPLTCCRCGSDGLTSLDIVVHQETPDYYPRRRCEWNGLRPAMVLLLRSMD